VAQAEALSPSELASLLTDPSPVTDWDAEEFSVKGVELHYDAYVSKFLRTVTYTTGDAEKKSFTEEIFPIYVPPVSEQTDAEKPKADGSDSVRATDAYWAKTSDQARSTAKWLATAIGAALLAIVGTSVAPRRAGYPVG
jgi:hypothetical protein